MRTRSLFKLLEASFELLVPLVVASIIDVGIKNGDKPYIIKMCIIMVALGLVGLICSVTAQYFAARAAVGFTKDCATLCLKRFRAFSYTKLDKLGTATVITRMTSDMNQVRRGQPYAAPTAAFAVCCARSYGDGIYN